MLACSSSHSSDSAPTISTQPASQTVIAGASASFSVAADGKPTPTFQWESSPDGSTWAALSGASNASYSFTAQQADNGRYFRAKASNTAGSATSNSAMLTVQWPPVFTTQPSAQTLTVGGSASFTVVASGNPAPTYAWERSSDGGATWGAVSGATSATYTFTPVLTDSGARFRAKASNVVATVTSNPVTLTVNAPGWAISGNGGSFQIADSANALNGLKVEVPAGSLANPNGTLNLMVKAETGLPGAFPASSGAVQASPVMNFTTDISEDFIQPITITVPYSVSSPAVVDGNGATVNAVGSNDVPSVFYFSATYGKWMALAVINIDTTAHTLTFRTVHAGRYVLAAIPSLVNSLPAVDTGFAPATDGFFHPNFGTFDSPGGSCAGMAAYTCWFYDFTKASKGAGLYSLYRDGDPASWQDDVNARELISRAHIATSQSWIYNWAKTDYKLGPKITGLLAISALKVTGQPLIMRLSDNYPNQTWGHAVVVYKYDNTLKRFYIYDVNFPNEVVTLDWDPTANGGLGTFSNYSKAAAYSPAPAFFATEGISTYISPEKFKDLYDGVESGWASSKFNTITLTSPVLDASGVATVDPAATPPTTVRLTGSVSGGLRPANYVVVYVNGAKLGWVDITSGTFATTDLQIPNQAGTIFELVATDDHTKAWDAYAGYKRFTVKVKGQSFFVNPGFETGTFAPWISERHLWADAGIGSVIPSDKSAIVSPGWDPHTTGNATHGALPMVYHGNYAFRVNNGDDSYHISSISQTAVVPAMTNPQIVFYWAAVMEQPNHPPEAQPYVDVVVTDTTSGTVLYHKHFYTGDPSYSGWIDYQNGWFAIPWQVVTVGNLAGLVGHKVTLKVEAADCDYGAHGGYAYFDGD
jgi:hypothetical protein